MLEGKLVGEPKPIVKWYKAGELVKENDDTKIESLKDGTQRLTIKNAKQTDADEYRCEASNDFGDVWADVTVQVKVPFSVQPAVAEAAAPTFVRTLEAVQTTEGCQVVFEACIVGQPMPEVKWFKVVFYCSNSFFFNKNYMI